MDAASRMMLLPVQSQKRFEKAAEENRQLTYQIDAQKTVIAALAESLPKVEELEQSIQEKGEQIAAINRQLSDATAVLLNILQATAAGKPAVANASQLLKFLLDTVGKILVEISGSAIREDSTWVPITSLLEIEDQVRKIIEDLHERGMYPETDEEADQRLQETQAHTVRVMDFLRSIMPSSGSD
jgi:ABC-type transporter Mla subunit MlaD